MKIHNKKKTKGFSLIELVVIIAIVAILVAVLAPSLLSYTEKSRAQKDETTMDEVVNSVQLAMSDSNCYDEMLKYSCDNNFITYTDSSGKYGQKIVDSEYWAPDGCGKGVTITFNPEKDSQGNTIYRLENAIVNDMTFGNGSVAEERIMEGTKIEDNQCYLKNAKLSEGMETGYLYNKIKATIGTDVITTSATYANSSYTIFIKFTQKDGVTVADVNGSFNGTNLDSGSQASIGSNTIDYIDNDIDKPIANTPTGGTTQMEITGSALRGSGSIVPDYKGGGITNNNNNNSAVDKPFTPMQNGQEYIVLDGTESMSFLLKEDDSVDILYDGNVAANIPVQCVTKASPMMTLSGTGTEYDGTYQFFADGYVELNGNIVAKAKDRWLNVEENTYLIVHKGDVWASWDGNHPIELVFDKDTLQGALLSINDAINENGDNNGTIRFEYPYVFTKYEAGSAITIRNVYDLLAMMNIQEKGHGLYFVVCGVYDYWGGSAQDTIVNNSMVTNVRWMNDVDGIVTKSLYDVTPTAQKQLSLTDTIDGKIIALKEDTKYYFDGELAQHIFINEDVPFVYEEGMTYREWIDSKYSRNTCMTPGHSTGWDSGTLYIPEQFLDSPCGEGYLQNVGIIDVYGITWNENEKDLYPYYDMIYCEGDITPIWCDTSSILWSHEAFTYEGAWFGQGYPIKKEFQSYDLFNYVINSRCIEHPYPNQRNSFQIYPAFTRNTTVQTVDITDKIQGCINTKYGLSLDRNKLSQMTGLPYDVELAVVKKDGDKLLLIDNAQYSSNSGTGYENLQIGIFIIHNGTIYEGWINQ